MFKGRQALGEWEAAAEAFGASLALKPDQPDVAREYASVLIELHRLEEAERVARVACQARPAAAGLLANLALIFLLQGRVELAEQAAVRAAQMDPQDRITALLVKQVREIREGKRMQPASLAELEGREAASRSTPKD